MKRRKIIATFVICMALFLIGCGGEKDIAQENVNIEVAQNAQGAGENELTTEKAGQGVEQGAGQDSEQETEILKEKSPLPSCG